MRRSRSDFNWHQYLASQLEEDLPHSVMSFYRNQPFNESLALGAAEYVALDFETTGLDPEKDDIISIGLVPFSLNRIKVAQAKHWLVRPSCSLSEESVVIHGITDSELTDAPTLLDVMDEVLLALEGKVVVVHHEFIEREFLYHSIKEHLNIELLFPMIDTMAIEALQHRKGWRNTLKKLLNLRLPSIRLADSRARYGLPRYQLHSSLTDAIATAELLQAQVRYLYNEQALISSIWR